MKKSIFIFLFFFFTSQLFHAQSDNDTLQGWMSKFYRIGQTEYSPDGRWATVKKSYDYNSDTLMVFDTQKPTKAIGNIVGLPGRPAFTQDGGLLATGLGRAEFWNMKTNLRTSYSDVSRAGVLRSLNRHFIWDKKGNVTVYSASGKAIHHLTGAQQQFATDNDNKLFIYRKKDSLHEVWNLSGDQQARIYAIGNTIKKISMGNSGRHVIVTETDERTVKNRITFIDTQTYRSSTLEGVSFELDEFLTVTEIQQSGAYFIRISKVKKADDGLVDIWYGNDGNLAQTEGSILSNRYYLWDSASGTLRTIPNERFASVFAVGSTRFFLAANIAELQNYVSRTPDVNMHIYDLTTDSYHRLDTVAGSRIYISNHGTHLVYFAKNQKWIFYSLDTMEKQSIGDRFLDNPTFSSDGRSVFFESKDGIWHYDIRKGSLQSLKFTAGKTARIKNRMQQFLGETSYSSIYISYMEKDDPVLISITDPVDYRASYIMLQNNRTREIVAATTNNIKEIRYDKKLQRFCIIEENFNMPPKLYYIDSRRKTKKLLFDADTVDKPVCSLKREIVSYTDSQGNPLKGILHYPADYNPQKKYPMVVRIYEIQSNAANEYLTPGYNNPIGFDLRTLLQKGYFVYMPDIVFSASGTGLSALDCVNSALDAIGYIKCIDFEKVGLMGHSHGGYETNFIATHSDRFATYISGAGNSDIVRSYFSYNYNFSSPFYWQFENGQYEMNVPFATNKELYFRNNPIHNVEKVNAPILLWAGKKDENIAWDQVMEFYIGLRRNSKQVVALFYPNEGHALGINTPERRDLHKRVLEWFDYFLHGKDDVPWIDKQMKKAS